MSATTDEKGQGYATVTVLTFKNQEAQRTAIAGLAELVQQARDLPGFQNCWVVDTGPCEAVMVTLYASQTAADEASASVRPHLGVAVGTHVTGPPQRWAGQIVTSSDNGVR